MELKTILRHIASEKCILVIGPELPFPENSSSRQQTVLNHFTQNNLGDLIPYKEDDFYFFPNKVKRLLAINSLIELYEGLPYSSIYEEIVQIPFSMVISMSPDDILVNTFTRHYGKDNFEYGYYKRQEKKEILNSPTGNFPVLYNLLGDFKDADSVILSFDDLYNFFSSIFDKSFQIPEKIRQKLYADNTQSILFIGFKFHAWYYKLLLRILGIDEKMTSVYPSDKPIEEQQVLSFYKNHFQMDFQSESAHSVIHEIFNQCQNKGTLRSRRAQTSFDIPTFTKYISTNQIEDAIALLDDYFSHEKESDKLQAFQILCSEYNYYKSTDIKGTKSTQELSVMRKSIWDSFLKLGDSIYHSLKK